MIRSTVFVLVFIVVSLSLVHAGKKPAVPCEAGAAGSCPSSPAYDGTGIAPVAATSPEFNAAYRQVLSVAGPMYAGRFGSGGCGWSCALPIAKCSAAALQAFAAKDISILVKCLAGTNFCPCVSCIPVAAARDWINKVLCASSLLKSGVGAAAGSPTAHHITDSTYEECIALAAEGKLTSDAEKHHCEVVVHGTHTVNALTYGLSNPAPGAGAASSFLVGAGAVTCDEWCQSGNHGSGTVIGTAPFCSADCSNCNGFCQNPWSQDGGCMFGNKICCCARA